MTQSDEINKVLLEAKKEALNKCYIPQHIRDKFEFVLTENSAKIVEKKTVKNDSVVLK